MAGLLSPIQFIGEHKGTLSIIVAAKFYYANSQDTLDTYRRRLNEISINASHGDGWPTEVGRSPGSPHQTDIKGLIVAASEHCVITYLRNIDSLWSLGTKQFIPHHHL